MTMQIPLQNFHLSIKGIKDELKKAIDEVLESQCFILGPKLERFEAEFASLCRTNYCIGTGNGTDALSLALLSLGIGPGDEVILPSLTFIATAHAVTLIGATPVFADIDPHTMTIDSKINNLITHHTKAVIAVNLFGQPCKFDELLRIATGEDISLVEDNAQAHGATYKGRICGGIGKIAATSFYPTKNLGAFGDGGAITTNDYKLAKFLFEARNLGRKGTDQGHMLGRNSRLDELQAAILSIKLPCLKFWNLQRADIAKWYTEELSELVNSKSLLTLPSTEPETVPVWHHYVIRSPYKDELRNYLTANGVGTNSLYSNLLPCHKHKIYKSGLYLPNTEEAAATSIALPIYPGLTKEQVQYVCRIIKDYYKHLEGTVFSLGPIS